MLYTFSIYINSIYFSKGFNFNICSLGNKIY